MLNSTEQDITQWASSDGKFRRAESSFRNHIITNGEFPPAKNRYHLYVSLACPWAHRTLILLQLKKLTTIIGISVVHPHMGPQGWTWTSPSEYSNYNHAVVPDPLFNSTHLSQLYLLSQPDYHGRFTVPILFDRLTNKIVNNESSEIIRILNSSFNDFLEEKEAKMDLYPENLRDKIDEMNEWIYDLVNNGVYKSGFATTQQAYQESVNQVFKGLDRIESILNHQSFLTNHHQLTEVDVRLFTTIIRFDVVYVSHFKCNLKTIRHDYPNIHRWLKHLYYWDETSAFRSTTNFDHIKCHYFTSHPQINPTRIIPIGPVPEILPP